jgi:hypothetical protein
MTDEQIEVCKALGKVTCLPASFDKRMCRTMFFKACDTPEFAHLRWAGFNN